MDVWTVHRILKFLSPRKRKYLHKYFRVGILGLCRYVYYWFM